MTPEDEERRRAYDEWIRRWKEWRNRVDPPMPVASGEPSMWTDQDRLFAKKLGIKLD